MSGETTSLTVEDFQKMVAASLSPSPPVMTGGQLFADNRHSILTPPASRNPNHAFDANKAQDPPSGNQHPDTGARVGRFSPLNPQEPNSNTPRNDKATSPLNPDAVVPGTGANVSRTRPDAPRERHVPDHRPVVTRGDTNNFPPIRKQFDGAAPFHPEIRPSLGRFPERFGSHPFAGTAAGNITLREGFNGASARGALAFRDPDIGSFRVSGGITPNRLNARVALGFH